MSMKKCTLIGALLACFLTVALSLLPGVGEYVLGLGILTAFAIWGDNPPPIKFEILAIGFALIINGAIGAFLGWVAGVCFGNPMRT